MTRSVLLACLAALLTAFLPSRAIAADDPGPAFRTEGGDDSLPWFRLVPGEFPPVGSARGIAGELIAVDHVNRTGVLRPDRTDAQRRGDWDLPLSFALLPFGSVSYHGAPAELRDVPIGAHLHGLFYETDPAEVVKTPGVRLSADAAFGRCLRLEDDFTFDIRTKRHWRIDAVDPAAGSLTATRMTDGAPDAKPTAFQVGPATRVWAGRCAGTLADLAPGGSVVLNLTVCTLKGPGRVTDAWLDAESRELATARQLEVHRLFQREHGLAGRIVAVDNAAGVVEVALFAGFDPALREEFQENQSLTAAVAEDSLRTWDQINDRKGGPVVAVRRLADPPPGDSGLRVSFKPSLLLEGFRPGRVVRLWAAAWKVDDLPREERLYQ